MDAVDVVVQLAVMAWAVARIVRAPTETVTWGWWSKAFWVAVAVVVTATVGTLSVPVGALCAVGRFRPSPSSGRVGLAEGEPWSR